MGETHSGTVAVVASEPPTPGEVWDALDRILNDGAFQASARRKKFLRFLVEETLAGRADRLKGFQIATAVFGRDETFDSQNDPVVRLEARRLRRDLEHYYLTAGHGDPLRISIPKGAYVPCFERQDATALSASPAPAMEAKAETVSSVPPNAPPDTTSGTHPTTTEDAVEKRGEATGRGFPRLVIPALLGIATIIAAAGVWLWNERLHERLETAKIEPQEHGPSVIVLPFELLSTREDDRFLAAGMTQQLITDLMRFGAFKLYSVPASFRQNASADPVDLGRSLAVAYVVKGSVRSGGEKVRVSTQLVDAKTGQVLWSETYDRSLTPDNLLGVQEDLARQLATRLAQPYGVIYEAVTAGFRKERPQTLFAYECVLRAYAYRRTFSRDLYAPTRACLEEVVRRDPRYADAWALLGWLHLDAARFGLVQEDRAASEMGQALGAASYAVDLEPKSVLALQALAAVTYYRGDYGEAERIQREAIALNPTNPESLAQLGWRLAVRSRWDEGLGYIRQAIDRSIDPPGWYYTLFAVHDYLQADFSEALRAAERAKTDGFGIGWSLVAIAQAALGNQDEAAKALVEMEARSPLLARDPAAAYRIHHADEPIIDRLVDGLRKAGWKEPNGSLTRTE